MPHLDSIITTIKPNSWNHFSKEEEKKKVKI